MSKRTLILGILFVLSLFVLVSHARPLTEDGEYPRPQEPKQPVPQPPPKEPSPKKFAAVPDWFLVYSGNGAPGGTKQDTTRPGTNEGKDKKPSQDGKGGKKV